MTKNRFSYLIICLLISTNVFGVSKQDEQHTKVAMRLIGHELLLSSGDFTTRVLPIERSENLYKISFDGPFVFDPGTLTYKTDSIMLHHDIADNYLVEVIHCETKDIIHSYEVHKVQEESMQACSGRIVPPDCYIIEINILDEDEDLTTVVEPVETKMTGLQIVSLITLIVSVLLILIHFIKRRKVLSAEINPDLIMIGKYQFDKRNLLLTLGQDEIELSTKEADLLNLLYSSANNTLKRESILKIVWEDEGAYVGRTLDVFISKLRKKLGSDENVRIVNVRGVGYKMIV
jgi:hypothetical protein